LPWPDEIVHYRLLPEILAEEDYAVHRIDFRWRPPDLLYIPQARALLRDVQIRFSRLEGADSELRTLVQGDLIVKLMLRMRLRVRHASYVWKIDQLAFLRSVTGFYTDYGIILRLLRLESGRGRFDSKGEAESNQEEGSLKCASR
jgi:hypothetical protein